MNTREINNYFGDMDLFLMDLILKGKIPENASVLDIGCGEGRNGVFFIRNGYDYHGWDTDDSKLKMLAYLSQTLSSSKARFEEVDLLEASTSRQFDFIICSRMLHFAKSKQTFFEMWEKIKTLLSPKGLLYVSMDSAVDNPLGKEIENGQYEFPDTKVRFALTKEIYTEIKKGFEEIEPLRTVVHHDQRAQSFLILRKP